MYLFFYLGCFYMNRLIIMEKLDKIAELLFLASTGNLSEVEKPELEKWLAENERHRQLLQEISTPEKFAEKYQQYRTIDTVGLQHRFERRIGSRLRIRLKRVLRIVAIVTLLLGVGLSILYYTGDRQKSGQMVTEVILPGKAGSILMLGDGRKIILTPGDTTQVDLQGEVLLSEKKDGLVYVGITGKSEEYNTVQVPRGGEFRITLSDGSFIHLNSESELRYPVTFTGDSRTVYLSGEAWFTVAKEVTRPFYVETDHLQIKVYGTSFCVNTQDAAQTTVALVSGQVGIQADKSEEYLLSPSDLACYNSANHTIKVQQTDLTPFVSWHEGLLVFEDEPLERIMVRLALWYDIEVNYADEEVRKQIFTGYLKRYDSIDIILKALQRTVSMHFTLEGKKLTLMN